MANQNILGTKPIPELLLKFAVPSVISMLVNSIYNLVDQIFIGQGVGYLGNAATNVTFPFVTLSLAVALMISVGTAANVGLNLGMKRQEEANRTLGTGFAMALTAGLLIMLFGEIFLIPLLKLFGATETVLPYAIDYARIYIIGLPMTTIGIMVNDEIRADGNPSYAMKSMLVGAAINIICDPIFIFIFKWGVAGAALATILGQCATMVISLLYMKKLKTMKLQRKNIRLRPSVMGPIILLGISSFLTQFTMLLMQIVMNKQAVKYGALSQYGSDIPLTVFGIVMKVNQIMVSIILGITSGCQPIFSFNYGAKNYSRVKDLTRFTLIVCCTVGIIGTIVLQSFPQQIISIFGQEDGLYNEFAVMCLKNMTFLIFILGVQMVASTYFQAIGKPAGAMIIALSRQLIFMIPSLIILPWLIQTNGGIGVKGVMWSFPLADMLTILLSSILLIHEMKLLNRQIKMI